MGETVEWYAWLVRDGEQWWAGCRRLDSDVGDFMLGPSPDASLLRRKIVEYAEELETWRPTGRARRVVVRWQGETAGACAAGVATAEEVR